MGYLEGNNGVKALLTHEGKECFLSGGLIEKIKNGYVQISDDDVLYTLNVPPNIIADFSGNNSDITDAKCVTKNYLY